MLACEQFIQWNQRAALAAFHCEFTTFRLREKILQRHEQIRTQTPFFLAHGVEVFSLEYQCKKTLSEVLRFLWTVAFPSHVPIERPPVRAAKFLERFLGCR